MNETNIQVPKRYQIELNYKIAHKKFASFKIYFNTIMAQLSKPAGAKLIH